MQSKNNIEDIHRLTPLQEGMLYHFLLDPLAPTHVVQLSFRLTGELNENVVAEAICILTARHAALRSAFVHKNMEEPVQVVLKTRVIPFHFEDIRVSSKTTEAKEEYLENLRRADLAKGFDIAKDPLMRIALFKVDDRIFEFLWTRHHILMDGWSTAVFINEFFVVYNGIVNNLLVQLPPVCSVVKFSKWLERYPLINGENFWKTYLEGAPAATGFQRMKRTSSGIRPYALKGEKIVFDSILSTGLRSLAGSLDVTLNALMSSLWSVLISKFNKSDDVIFGTVVSGRPAAIEGIERMIGLFINTIPVRVRSNDKQTVAALIKAVQKDAVNATPHHYLSLSRVQALAPIKTELIDHLWVFENFPVKETVAEHGVGGMDQIEIDAVKDHVQTNYPLTVTVYDGVEITLRFDFDSNAYATEFVNALGDYYSAIVRQTLDNPHGEIGSIQLMSDAFRTNLLSTVVRKNPLPEGNPDLVSWFGRQAQVSPAATAIRTNGVMVTYQQLDERSSQLARYLLDCYQVCPGDVIGVLLSRSEHLVVVLMGILKTGAAFVPVDVAYPVERIKFILEDASAKILIANHAGSISRIGLAEDGVIYFDELHKTLDTYPGTRPNVAIQPESLAYVIYTSGSTGRPKGVMIAHSGLTHFLTSIQDELKFGSNDIFLGITTMSFDPSILEIFLPLTIGASVLLANDLEYKNPFAIAALVRSFRPTVIQTTPTMLQLLFDAGLSDGQGAVILCGGEKLTPQLSRSSRKHGFALFNIYGPTETTVWSTLKRVEDETQIANVGHPLPGVSLYIIDAQNNLCPPGVEGEICIHSAGIAKGYNKLPELSAEKFCRNPLAEEEVIYRTGDVGYWEADGSIAFVGRRDFQVKIRSHRIELGEIEGVLNGHPDIVNSVVVAAGDIDDRHLVAYYTAEKTLHSKELTQYLYRYLPSYMIPGHWMQLEGFALNSNGKIDRTKLPAMVSDGAMPASVRAPQNEVEMQLLEIWKEVLHKSIIDTRDNFFESGGHSLTAVKLLSRIQTRMKVQLELQTIFQNPTIETLANAVSAGDSLRGHDIPRAAEQPFYEASHQQKRMWLLQQHDESKSVYNIFGVYAVKDLGSHSMIATALDVLIERHECLRTRFIHVDGRVVQQVLAPDDSGFILESISAPGSEADAGIQDILRSVAETVFDLAKGPLFKVVLVQLNNNETIFAYCFNHIIADGWSVNLFLQELFDIYAALRRGVPVQLQPVAITFKDFSEWQIRKLAEADGGEDRQFWLKELAGELSPARIYPDRSPKSRMEYSGEIVHLKFDNKALNKVKTVCLAQGATLHMFLVTAVKVLLFRYTGHNDVVVGIPVAGRAHLELEKVIGFFINTVPVRMSISSDANFVTLLRQVKEKLLLVYRHQHYPFDKIVTDLNFQIEPDRHPLFDVMVVLQNLVNDEPTLPAGGPIEARPYGVERTVARYDLAFIFSENEDGLDLKMEYKTSVYFREKIKGIGECLERLFDEVVENGNQSLPAIDILSGSLKQRLTEFGVGPVVDRRPGTLVGQFNSVVIASLNSTAIVTEEKEFTYGQLDQRSHDVAMALKNKYGVRKGDRVISRVDEPEWMIPVMLGILKAGAIYVPVDPSFPESRFTYILENSGATVVISMLMDHDENKLRGNYSVATPDDFHESRMQADALEQIDPDDPAYLIYTSGSTGKPKGVLVGHHGTVNMVLDQIDKFGIRSTDRILRFASISFDASVYETFMALLSGASLYLPPLKLKHEGEQLVGRMAFNRVTVATLPPAYVSALPLASFSFLRIVITAGEAPSNKLAGICQYVEAYYNAYGPTECSVCVSTYKVGAADQSITAIPIGKPVSNLRIYVLDRFLRLLPPGVPGQICISGVGLAKGYYNNPAMTNERFIENPNSPDEKLYLTGDVGVWLNDGNLRFIGREDSQVKIRGYRIELLEVEHALKDCRHVDDGVVTMLSDEASVQLCAYYTSHRNATVDDIRSQMMRTLPLYMVPSRIIQVDSIPLTSTGKVDLATLRAMEVAPINEEDQDAHSDKERMIRDTIRDILARPVLRMSDNFFFVGGDSIKAIQVSARIAQKGFRIEVKDILKSRSIGDMAERMKPLVSVADQSPARGNALLSPIQHEFFKRRMRRPQHYNQAVVLSSRSRLDLGAVDEILTTLINHHDALRLTFCEERDTMIQTFRDPAPVSAQFVDLRGESDAMHVMQSQADHLQQTFDLENGPLFRFVVFSLPEGDHLLMILHHLVVDAVSWRILFEDLDLLFDQFSKQQTFELPLKTDSYSKWTGMLHASAVAGTFDEELEQWTNHERIDYLISSELEESENILKDCAAVSFVLPKTETATLLTEANHAHNTSIKDLLLCAVTRGFCRVFDLPELVVAMEGHGREDLYGGIDVSRTVGWFTALYPLKIRLSDADDLGSCIVEVKETLRSVPGNGIGYGILRCLKLLKENERSVTSPEVSFNYLGQFDTDTERTSFEISKDNAGDTMDKHEGRGYKFDVSAIITDGELVVNIFYDTRQFKSETMQRLRDACETSLGAIVQHCLSSAPIGVATDFYYKDISTEDINALFN